MIPRTSTSLGWRLAQASLLTVVGLWLLSLVLVMVWERIDTTRAAHAIVVLPIRRIRRIGRRLMHTDLLEPKV